MATSILLSGPPFAGKSQEARRLRQEETEPTIIVSFQELYIALSGDVRDPVTGLYPPRDERLLPTVEFMRLAAIEAAVNRDIGLIAANSDGSPERRSFLLGLMGTGAVERVITQPYEVLVARAADQVTGVLSFDCNQALQRWFGRLR